MRTAHPSAGKLRWSLVLVVCLEVVVEGQVGSMCKMYCSTFGILS